MWFYGCNDGLAVGGRHIGRGAFSCAPFFIMMDLEYEYAAMENPGHVYN